MFLGCITSEMSEISVNLCSLVFGYKGCLIILQQKISQLHCDHRLEITYHLLHGHDYML